MTSTSPGRSRSRGRLVAGLATVAAATSATGAAAWLWRNQDKVIMRRPFNEWTFTHMNRLLPAETVPRSRSPKPLPGRDRPLDVDYWYAGRSWRLAQLHKRTNTTAFVVLHNGRLVHELYPGRFAGPRVRMQLFSVTKSLTSMLIGIALEDGLLNDVTDHITKYVPELIGTAYDGPSIEHLLDMSSGTGNREVWDDPASDIARFTRAMTTGGSLLDVVRSIQRTSIPGVRFNYSTIDTQVLGWVLEAASGRSLAQYAADKIWSRLATEADAYYWLSRERLHQAIAGGSFNATARDTARLGLVMARGGEFDGRPVVPAGWVERSRRSDRPHLQVGALGEYGVRHYGYANQWWTLGGDRRAFTGLGIHGQYLYVDPSADVVIVKCSAWPTEEDDERDAETVAALQAIVEYLDA
jgi:CubicO group peptidase (beta-lactamase class C family)